MRTIGIRQLRQRASEVLRSAENGETFQVTDRGRPVALITPVRDVSPLERLRAQGDVSIPTAEIDDLPEPLTLDSRAVPPSKILAKLRAHDR